MFKKYIDKGIDVEVSEKDTYQNKSFSPNANLWNDVKTDIELKIISGEYPVGKRLPSIAQVSDKYNVGTTTAQKVLESLCEEGTVIKKQGVGYFVKPYIKDMLLKSHINELKKRMTLIISYGIRIGLDNEKISELFQETFFQDSLPEE